MEQQSYQPTLSWDDVYEKFEKLIWFAANQAIRNNSTDGMVDKDDLFQEGLIKLRECYVKWCLDPAHNKDMDEFGSIFRISLFRKVKHSAGRSLNPMDIDDASYMLSDPNASADYVVDRMEQEDKAKQLMQALSPIAQSIVREILEPSELTMFEVWADIKRKEMIREQGHRVNVPKDTTVRMKHIVRSLKITSKQYDNAMIEIKRTGASVYSGA